MKLDVSKPLLDLNDELAQKARALLDEHDVFVLDLMASPGAGKTSTILASIGQLRERFSIAVIEGDIASDVDSQRIKEQGIPAVQINTGGACHLESRMVLRALDALDLDALDLIIIENVGNLVCPTDFYLGEDAKVMILSVPEGHDKPLKYPGIFQVSAAVILNKIDTLPVFDFDEPAFRASVGQLNPQAPIFPMSARKGQGVTLWTQWLADRIERAAQQRAQRRAQQRAQRREDR
ncbi:MAG: hydrogenase nickel incorporation protein HypB [Coriobacteriales bacterium]|jgi:hydrogenase nickel incorporation protein HypB|nr:hydrogenase nickel incorporation protein HypB [Coriobacteriales bacterium]